MNQPWIYMCSPSWTPLPLPSPSHPSQSSQCTSPEHPFSSIEPGLVICFTYGNIHVPMLFSQIIPPLPSPPESKTLFFSSVSPLLSRIDCKYFYGKVMFLFFNRLSRFVILPRWLSGKESAYQCRRCEIDPWVRKIPWRRKWQPTPVFLLGKSHGQRSLVGHSPRGLRESDTNEPLSTEIHAC